MRADFKNMTRTLVGIFKGASSIIAAIVPSPQPSHSPRCAQLHSVELLVQEAPPFDVSVVMVYSSWPAVVQVEVAAVDSSQGYSHAMSSSEASSSTASVVPEVPVVQTLLLTYSF